MQFHIGSLLYNAHKMWTRFFSFVFFVSNFTFGLKTWLPSTDVDNELNWNPPRSPRNCDDLRFPIKSDITVQWKIKEIDIIGLSLPETGSIIFQNDAVVTFLDEKACYSSSRLMFSRDEIKGWLDPYNWNNTRKSDWLPHIERIPCAGETVVFPSGRTFAVQLPTVIVPMGKVVINNQDLDDARWGNFLQSEEGQENFKGDNDLRNYLWKTTSPCLNPEACVCVRSPYVIRDGFYQSTSAKLFEEAVCLYARPKCERSPCANPVVPDGHCCGVCGAVIELSINVEGSYGDVYKVDDALSAVAKAHSHLEDRVSAYIGFTKSQDIQIVLMPVDPGDTVNILMMADLIETRLTGLKSKLVMSARYSGLPSSGFGRTAGLVFGTLFGILAVFSVIYYIFVVSPLDGRSGRVVDGQPFRFSRFDNAIHEVNSQEILESATEAGPSEKGLSQAFDNPMYSPVSVEAPSSEPKTESEPIQTEHDFPVFIELQKKKEEDSNVLEANAELESEVENIQDDFNEIEF